MAGSKLSTPRDFEPAFLFEPILASWELLPKELFRRYNDLVRRCAPSHTLSRGSSFSAVDQPLFHRRCLLSCVTAIAGGLGAGRFLRIAVHSAHTSTWPVSRV